jgi:hypothetical protein
VKSTMSGDAGGPVDAKPASGLRGLTANGCVVALAVTVMFGLAVGVYWQFFTGNPSEWSFSRVDAGMTVEEVQAILGPGREISREHVPEWGAERTAAGGRRTTRVVEGDRFFEWPQEDGAFYVSFAKNRVAEKHHSFLPSF